MKLHDIIGQLHAKRALEVALAGNHTLAFFGNEEAKAMAKAATRLGVTASAIQACPCGLFGHEKSCVCTPSQIGNWRRSKTYQNALRADIVVECPPNLDYEVEGWPKRTHEPESARLARVETKGKRPADTLGNSSQALVECAQKQLGLDDDRVQAIISVAQSIASLAHADAIGIAHIAEAIQYRPRQNLDWT